MTSKAYWSNADMYEDEKGYIRTPYVECLILNVIRHTYGSKHRSRYDAVIDELRLYRYHMPFTDVVALAQNLCVLRHVKVTHDR